MERELTPEQAVQDFIDNVLPHLFEGESRYRNKRYNRIKQLEYALQGRGKKKFSATWAEAVLSEFAPDRYRMEQHVVFYIKE